MNEIRPDQLDNVSGGVSGSYRDNAGVEERIYQIVADYLDLERSKITGSSDLVGTLGADEYDLLDIVSKIEETFCIRIPRSEMSRFIVVEDLILYVKRHLP